MASVPCRRSRTGRTVRWPSLVVTSSVAKKLGLLVAADTNTRSGKARNAREYGTQIVAEGRFWRMLRVTVI